MTGLLATLTAFGQTPMGVLIAAAILDYWVGDPWRWPHPVQGMGAMIQVGCRLSWQTFKSPAVLKGAGVGLATLVVLVSAGLGGSIVFLGQTLHPLLGWGLSVILLASCFAGRSLRAAAADVLRPLQSGDMAGARSQLKRYVGRDTDHLSQPEILRAVLETVAENTTDGVMAPLFYGILGVMLGALLEVPLPGGGAVPLALAYKAVSTLDSMVGYRTSPYIDLGWFSARLDDGLTWLPCRLTVMTLGCLTGKLVPVWQLCRAEADKDPSPNSGWSECAYAAILEVQLGGLNTYKGVVKFKPFLGKPRRPITPERIDLALRLMRNSVIVWLVLAIALWFLLPERFWLA